MRNKNNKFFEENTLLQKISSFSWNWLYKFLHNMRISSICALQGFKKNLTMYTSYMTMSFDYYFQIG